MAQATTMNSFSQASLLGLLEAGHGIIFVPEAELYDRVWRAKQEYFLLAWSYGRRQQAHHVKQLSVRDPYMLRRMIWHVMRHVHLFLCRLWRDPRQACGDAVYVLAFVSRGIEWLLTPRRTC